MRSLIFIYIYIKEYYLLCCQRCIGYTFLHDLLYSFIFILKYVESPKKYFRLKLFFLTIRLGNIVQTRNIFIFLTIETLRKI